MTRAAAVAIGVLAACTCPGAGATAREKKSLSAGLFRRPVEVATHQADLVVVGQVLSVGQPRKISVTPRGSDKPVRRSCCSCRVQAVRTIKSPAGRKHSAGSTFQVNAPAVPRGSQVSRGPTHRCVLSVGRQYMLLVQRLPGTAGWMVPYGSDHYLTASKAVIQAATKAVRVDDWAWGPTAGGLQLAVLSKWTRWTHMVRDRRTIFFRAYVALRNTSPRAVTVNLRPADAPLTIEVRRADGTVVAGDFYRSLAWRLKGTWPVSAETLDPGEVIFVGQTGAKAIQLEASLDVPAGAWTVHVGYRATRKATEAGKRLWTGTVAAKPLAIEVVPRVSK